MKTHNIKRATESCNTKTHGLTSKLAVLTGAFLITACASPYKPDANDANFARQLPQLNRPLVQPTRSFSNYSVALGCMDRLLRDMRLPTTLITSKNIPDPSGKVTVATKEMIITALSQMSRTSSAFRYVDYEVDLVRQDTVQNLTTLLISANQLQIQRPALYVSGAISSADLNVGNNNFDAGTSASKLETGFSRSRNGTLIGLELHLGEFRTRTLIPGVESSNEIVISSGGWGVDVAGRISNYGVQFSMGKEFNQGTSGAARTLVELGVIELVGKWSRVPYWQCLSLDQTHPDFQRTLLDWYSSESEEERKKTIQNLLYSRGYLASAQTEGASLKQAIVRFQADQDIVAHGQLTFEMYERLMRDYVSVDSQGHIARVGWEKRATPVLAQIRQALTSIEIPKTIVEMIEPSTPNQDSATLSAEAATPRQMNRIEMKIENIPTPANRMGTSFEMGEKLFMSAAIAQTAHMWCFYEDATNATMRIYPNTTHRHSLTQANRAIRLPDWMNPNPGFYIEATDPGQEVVTCFAHSQDLLSADAPAVLTSASLDARPNIKLAQIRQALQQQAQKLAAHANVAAESISEASVTWAVRTKQTAASSTSASSTSTTSTVKP